MEDYIFQDDPGFNDAAATLNQLLKVLQNPSAVSDQMLISTGTPPDSTEPFRSKRSNSAISREHRKEPRTSSANLFSRPPISSPSGHLVDSRPGTREKDSRPGTREKETRPGTAMVSLKHQARPGTTHKESRSFESFAGNSRSLPSLDNPVGSGTHLPVKSHSASRRRQAGPGRPESHQDARLASRSGLPEVQRPLTAQATHSAVSPHNGLPHRAVDEGVFAPVSPLKDPPLLHRKRDKERDAEQWWVKSPPSIDENSDNLASHVEEILKVREEFEEEMRQLKEAHLEELRQLKDAHVEELDRVWSERGRLVQAHEEECQRMEAENKSLQDRLTKETERLKEERDQLRSMLQARDDELANVRTQQSRRQLVPDMGSTADEFTKVQTALLEREAESLSLKSQLESKCWELKRLEAQLEKEVDGCTEFVKRIAISSSSPALEDNFDLRNSEFLGVGNYGYVMTGRSKLNGKKVVIKLQSDRWASVAMREWAHGVQAGTHDNIVEYINVIMHRDHQGKIRDKLKMAFESGSLRGRLPTKFPHCYFCLALEYMDRGTAQSLIDKDLLGVVDTASITRQVALALAYMHKKKQTHNDIKPENILLCQDRRGKNLTAKLADLGLACHSLDRVRDCDLFGYTVFCMGLKEKFRSVPSNSERKEELSKFRACEPRSRRDRSVWQVLAGVIDGMWSGCTEMHEIAYMNELQGYEVHVPDSSVKSLEEAASRATVKRATVNHHVLQLQAQQLASLPDSTADGEDDLSMSEDDGD